MSISQSLVYPRTHKFHIPVMGTGHSIDTPLRVARWGISSVISLVDDVLVEQVHKLHCQRRDMPFEAVSPKHPRARAERIRRYMDFIWDDVQAQMEHLRAQSFAPDSDKTKYFEMLPDSSPLRQDWLRWKSMANSPEKTALEQDLSSRMEPGSIDANIMTKLDRRPTDSLGVVADARMSDAKMALEGFALSRNCGNMIFSAGINPTLYGTIEEFSDFYRTATSEPSKGIIIKVSDFRSALTQGRFLAKKGLEVREFRIESGLNCGGHAFASDGELLGPILEEFRKERPRLKQEFAKAIRGYFDKKAMEWPASAEDHEPAVTVQGGIGNVAEHTRLIDDFGMDATGWGSPFLLVAEATPIDDETRLQLAKAGEDDVYLSDSSPLGVPFNNLRGSSSEQELRRKFNEGRAGSACPKGYLVANKEFTELPVCTASKEYQSKKIEEVGGYNSATAWKVAVKECICHQLGNGALQYLRNENAELRGSTDRDTRKLPVSICPGPNIAWFTRNYSLREMVDHIYGRIPSLVPSERPNMFAKEIDLYMEHFDKLLAESHPENTKQMENLATFKVNLAASLSWYRDWLTGLTTYEGENLASLGEMVASSEERLLLPEESALASAL